MKRWILVSPPRARLGWSIAIAAGALGCVLFLSRSDDAQIRLRALNDTGDLEAYLWLVDHTRPQDLVVTELPSPAGRRMVATTEVFSDPYFPWQPRNLRRLAYSRRCRES